MPATTQAHFKQSLGWGWTHEELRVHSTRAITELMGKLTTENCQGYITITPKQSLSLERGNPYLILIGQRSNFQNLLVQGLQNFGEINICQMNCSNLMRKNFDAKECQTKNLQPKHFMERQRN